MILLIFGTVSWLYLVGWPVFGFLKKR